MSATTVQLALQCHRLSPLRLADYLDFFDHRAFTDNPGWSGCYCAYPLREPGDPSWSSKDAAANRACISGCIGSGSTDGYLAYHHDAVVGWCSAGRIGLFPMHRTAPRPGEDPSTLGVVSCFVVAPDWRGKGVATALLRAACSGLKAQGLKAVLARPKAQAQGDAAHYHGPLSMFLAAGFRVERELDHGLLIARLNLQSIDF